MRGRERAARMPGPHGGNREGSSKRGLSRSGVHLSKASPFGGWANRRCKGSRTNKEPPVT